MDFWMLTEKGKRFLMATERGSTENEARVMEFLNRVGSAPIEIIAHVTRLDEYTIQDILKRLNEKSWVWKKATRFAKF